MKFTRDNAAYYGRKGGNSTRDRHGVDYYREIGRKGKQELIKRHFGGCEETFNKYFADLGRWHYWLSTGLPMRYGLDGTPIYKRPKFPGHTIPF